MGIQHHTAYVIVSSWFFSIFSSHYMNFIYFMTSPFMVPLPKQPSNNQDLQVRDPHHKGGVRLKGWHVKPGKMAGMGYQYGINMDDRSEKNTMFYMM